VPPPSPQQYVVDVRAATVRRVKSLNMRNALRVTLAIAVLLALTNLTETLKNAGITDATAKENTIAALDNGWLPYGEANQRFKARTRPACCDRQRGASVGEELHRVA